MRHPDFSEELAPGGFFVDSLWAKFTSPDIVELSAVDDLDTVCNARKVCYAFLVMANRTGQAGEHVDSGNGRHEQRV
jgi:hypothetical protein